MINPSLAKEILDSASPDGWGNKWSQVNRFGGGNAVELEVGELLHSLVRAVKPNVIVETGTHKGFSSLMIAEAIRRNGFGHLYSIDINDYGFQQDIKKFGFANQITFIHADSAKALPEVIKKVEKIDFLWLDAEHATESVLGEFNAAKGALKVGSYVAFHDTISDPREKAAVDIIAKANPYWEKIHFKTARGFDLLRMT